jgi:hypothetical protein
LIPLTFFACAGSTSSSHDLASDAGGAGDSGDAGTIVPATCTDAALPADIHVADVDLEGYPPYAGDGCTIVYVASSSGAPGGLHARDLSTGADVEIAPASETPRRPTVAGNVIAWEAQDMAGRAVVRVRVNGNVSTPAAGFDHATEPRAATNGVAFTAWLTADPRSDTDVVLYDVATGQTDVVLGGPGQQRFADISNGAIAASDFSEDPDLTFDNNETDLADVVLYDRSTHAVTHRPRPGKQAFPLLVSSSRLAYLDWAEVHPEPKLSKYTLRAGDLSSDTGGDVTIASVTNTSSDYILPSGRNATLEWIDGADGYTRLWRAPADLSSAPAIVAGLDGLLLYAPAAASSFIVLGTRAPTGGDVVLRGVR